MKTVRKPHLTYSRSLRWRASFSRWAPDARLERWLAHADTPGEAYERLIAILARHGVTVATNKHNSMEMA